MNGGRRKIRIGNRRIGGGWWRGPLLVIGWLMIAMPIALGGWVVSGVRRWNRDLPAVPDLAAWAAGAAQTSQIVAVDGTLLAELPFVDGKASGRRTLTGGRGIPAVLVYAVLAAEDARFAHHRGVDYQAIVRAAWKNWQAGGVREGASTITQQLARNLLPVEIGNQRSVLRKAREVLLARQIERAWTKTAIFGAYLDLVYFGAGAYGVAAAAEAYFAKPLSDLDLGEAALLAGLIQAPSRLDPWRDPRAARARRDEVLGRIARAKWRTHEETSAAAAQPLRLARNSDVYGTRAPWYTEHVRRHIAETMPAQVERGGLTVETAADPGLARIAEDEVDRATRSLDRGEGLPEMAAVVWDHHTGYVEAMVGGRTWASSQFDRLTQACRQPGSAWKPLVYGAAIERGVITQGTPLRDAPIAEYDPVTGVHWKPRAGKAFRGVALVADALAQSMNAPAIDVLDRVGAESVIGLARRLGVTTPVSELRPMALGASCVKPIELARAYAVIARRGWDVVPRVIVRIRRGHEVLLDAAVPEDPMIDPARRLDRLAAVGGRDPSQRVGATGALLMDAHTGFLLSDLLTGVVRRGTGSAARAIDRPAAGKTGTTNDNSDAWFAGFTARLVTVVWVGHDSPTVKLGPRDDGAHAALPSWIRLVRAAEGDRPAADVPGPPPDGIERARIDRETGLLAAPGSGGAIDLWFVHGTAPTERAERPGGAGDFARRAREF